MMKVGKLQLKNNIFFAPMAGYSDMACRLLAVEEGCGLVFSEMINVIGLSRKDKKTLALMNIHPQEKPIAIQLFGKDPEQFYSAAKIAEENGANIIDINMGCPMRKVTNGGSGAALMKEPAMAQKIIERTVAAVKVPVTVKFRSGWDEKSINVVELARMAERSGVSAVALHPRTRAQMFKDMADWELIKQLRKAVKIPVIGSGDIVIPEDVKAMLEQTGCAAVMIGRAAIGNPWIFFQALEYLRTGEVPSRPGFAKRVEMYLKHTRRLVEYKGERRAIPEMRKFAVRYLSGEPGAAKLRKSINKLSKLSELESLLLPMIR